MDIIFPEGNHSQYLAADGKGERLSAQHCCRKGHRQQERLAHRPGGWSWSRGLHHCLLGANSEAGCGWALETSKDMGKHTEELAPRTHLPVRHLPSQKLARPWYCQVSGVNAAFPDPGPKERESQPWRQRLLSPSCSTERQDADPKAE